MGDANKCNSRNYSNITQRMNIFKRMFSGSPENPDEEKKQKEANDFDVLKYDGVAALQQGNPDYAVKCFRHALDLRDDLETRDYLTQALIRNNQLDEAYEELRHLYEAQPDNVEILLRMADVAYMRDNYDDMTAVCVKARDLSADDPRVSFASARAFVGQGNGVVAIAMLTKAIADAQKQVAQDSSDAQAAPSGILFNAYLLRGQTLLQMGDVTTAMADADYLEQRLPEQEEVLLLKARCLSAQNQHAEAEQRYAKVIELNPFSIDGYRGRGAERLAQGNRKGAAEDAEEVLRLNPQEAQVNGDFQVEGKENIAEIIAKLKAKREANMKK